MLYGEEKMENSMVYIVAGFIFFILFFIILMLVKKRREKNLIDEFGKERTQTIKENSFQKTSSENPVFSEKGNQTVKKEHQHRKYFEIKNPKNVGGTEETKAIDKKFVPILIILSQCAFINFFYYVIKFLANSDRILYHQYSIFFMIIEKVHIYFFLIIAFYGIIRKIPAGLVLGILFGVSMNSYFGIGMYLISLLSWICVKKIFPKNIFVSFTVSVGIFIILFKLMLMVCQILLWHTDIFNSVLGIVQILEKAEEVGSKYMIFIEIIQNFVFMIGILAERKMTKR